MFVDHFILSKPEMVVSNIEVFQIKHNLVRNIVLEKKDNLY